MSPFYVNMQTAMVTTTIGAIVVLGIYLYQRKKKNSIPEIWEPVGKVTSLYMYPLKSGRRTEIKTVQCTDCGFQMDESNPHLRDRCLVVYRADNKEIKTARTYPKLLLISVTAHDKTHFNLTAPDMAKLQVEVPNKYCKVDQVVMFLNEKIFMADCGDEAARWVSRYILGEASGLRLGFHDGLRRRNIKNTHKEYLKVYEKLNNSSTGMYSDLTSYLLINQLSVDDLVTRIPNTNVSINNFRPNIVVNGGKITPYCEDNWDWIKVGSVVFRNVKVCTRCTLTTLDPETGVKSKEHEPIKTLNTYRNIKQLTNRDFEGETPVMGIHLGLISAGEINVGDTVYLGKN